MPQYHDDRTETEPGRRPPEAAAQRRPYDADVPAPPIPERFRTLTDDLAARSDPETPR